MATMKEIKAAVWTVRFSHKTNMPNGRAYRANETAHILTNCPHKAILLATDGKDDVLVTNVTRQTAERAFALIDQDLFVERDQ
jgi:hypothetical protein